MIYTTKMLCRLELIDLERMAETCCRYTTDMKIFPFFLIPLILFLSPGVTLGYGGGMCVEGDCVNGQGALKYSSGTQYVGEFRDDKFNGHGTLTYPSGTQYVGMFKDGKKHGDAE